MMVDDSDVLFSFFGFGDEFGKAWNAKFVQTHSSQSRFGVFANTTGIRAGNNRFLIHLVGTFSFGFGSLGGG